MSASSPCTSASSGISFASRRLSRMAAGEDQPQAVVVHAALVLGHSFVLLRVEADELLEPIGAVREGAVAAKPVDRPPAGGGGDPGTRVLGHAVALPRRHGSGKRVL